MDKYDIISYLLDVESKSRDTITRLQLSPKEADEYSTADLERARKILGLVDKIIDVGFEVIDEWTTPEGKAKASEEWAYNANYVVPLRELLKKVAPFKYKYSAACDSSGCRPDAKGIVTHPFSIDFDYVGFIAEAMEEEGDEDQKELARDWFRLVEELHKVMDEFEKPAEVVRGPPYDVVEEAVRRAGELKEALSAICSIKQFASGEELLRASHAGCLMIDLAKKVGGYAEIGGKKYVFFNDEVRLSDQDIEAFKLAEQGLGKKVGFTIPYSDHGDVVKAAEVLNDLTNFVHEYAGMLFRVRLPMEAMVTKNVGRCEIVVGSDRLLEELCISWDRAVAHSLDAYADVDVRPLKGMVVGNRGDFTVGSAPGHKTVFIKEDGRVRVSYYDRDGHIRQVMSELFEDIAGCKCEDKYEFLECSCKLTDREDAIRLGAILSRATTMDIRYDNEEACEEYEDEEEFFKEFVKEEKEDVLKLINKIS